MWLRPLGKRHIAPRYVQRIHPDRPAAGMVSSTARGLEPPTITGIRNILFLWVILPLAQRSPYSISTRYTDSTDESVPPDHPPGHIRHFAGLIPTAVVPFIHGATTS